MTAISTDLIESKSVGKSTRPVIISITDIMEEEKVKQRELMLMQQARSTSASKKHHHQRENKISNGKRNSSCGPTQYNGYNHNSRRSSRRTATASAYSNPKRKKKKQHISCLSRRKDDDTSTSTSSLTTRKSHQDSLAESPITPCTYPSKRMNYDIEDKLASIPTPQEQSRYVSLDCEMVGVGAKGIKSALARVCVVDWDGNVILDKFVRNSEPVTDFRTYVSGIREEDLRSKNAIDLYECSPLVCSILKDKILIGHALKNDLQALEITHPCFNTRDTAKYTPYMTYSTSSPLMLKNKNIISYGNSTESDCSSTTSCSSNSSLCSSLCAVYPQYQLRPRRLKELAEEVLGISIQKGGKEHSPIEDARAALALYKLARSKWERVIEYNIQKNPNN